MEDGVCGEDGPSISAALLGGEVHLFGGEIPPDEVGAVRGLEAAFVWGKAAAWVEAGIYAFAGEDGQGVIDLLHITADFGRFSAGGDAADDGDGDAGEACDEGDDDEEFDEGEASEFRSSLGKFHVSLRT